MYVSERTGTEQVFERHRNQMSIFGATVSACDTGPNRMISRPLGMRLVNKEFVSASMRTR